MFDVSWDDPASETVAQHRERKERDERSSLKSEDSSDSSKVQTTRRPSVFDIVSNRKKALASKRAISLLKTDNLIPGRKRLSTITAVTDGDSMETVRDTAGDRPNDALNDRLRDSVADTILSSFGSHEGPNGTHSSWSSVTDNISKTYEIQPLARNSFVTRSTEVAISPQDYTNVLDALISEVHISADFPSPDEYTIDMGSDIFQFPTVPRRPGAKRSDNRTPLKGEDICSMSPDSSKSSDFWKPPVDWKCPSDDQPCQPDQARKPRKRAPRPPNHERRGISASDPEITHLQRHIRRMEAANPKIMLERLKEEWTEVVDATIYKELEFEKQLWMLTALRFLSNKAWSDVGIMDKLDQMDLTLKPPSGASKILSLYENQASASFLASFTAATEIHHLATAPISPSSIPAIHPLTVPNPYHKLPYAANLFSSITSISLPSLLPSPSILPLLRECNRLLLPCGTLCLTILDPSPVPTTLGPRFRAWLDKHLLLNLEKQFRCMSPGRLLPAWIQHAGFSCNEEGAKVAIIKFWATGSEEGNVGELTTVVGRMLWKEIWGSFVEGERWWWDDEGVREECEKLGTRWECAVIEALKLR